MHMVELKEAQDVYTEQFERLLADGDRLEPVRRAAFERFRTLGFPTLRHEDWRFTNVAPIASTPFEAAPLDGRITTEADLAADLLDGRWPRLVFVNGHLAPELCAVPPEAGPLRLTSLAEALAADPGAVEPHLTRHAPYDEHPFTALNTALMGDGACVLVPDGAVLKTPIHLLFIAEPRGEAALAAHPRNLIVAGRGCQATIVETYLGRGRGAWFTNAVTEIIAGDNAVLDHYKVVREAPEAFHVGTTHFHQGRDSTVTSQAVTLGGALVRNDLTTVLAGQGAHCALNGLYVLGDRQHVDNHLRVEHASPHCDSREYFKGVLDDRSRAVFTGRIVVEPDAQKTDAKQTNMNLLLSADAQVDTKPQLEIFADDVKCTHGATIGQVQPEAIFYLRARGIDAEAARSILVYAFIGENLDKVRPAPLQRRLRDLLLDRIPQGGLIRESL